MYRLSSGASAHPTVQVTPQSHSKVSTSTDNLGLPTACLSGLQPHSQLSPCCLWPHLLTLFSLPTGIASMTVPVYIAEVSPPSLRGRFVTINTLFITGGQFFASVVDGAFSSLPEDGWRCVCVDQGTDGSPWSCPLLCVMWNHTLSLWVLLGSC